MSGTQGDSDREERDSVSLAAIAAVRTFSVCSFSQNPVPDLHRVSFPERVVDLVQIHGLLTILLPLIDAELALKVAKSLHGDRGEGGGGRVVSAGTRSSESEAVDRESDPILTPLSRHFHQTLLHFHSHSCSMVHACS